MDRILLWIVSCCCVGILLVGSVKAQSVRAPAVQPEHLSAKPEHLSSKPEHLSAKPQSQLLLWHSTSLKGLFHLSIRPRTGRYFFGRYHDWIVHIENNHRQIVADAHLRVDGGMAAHGHGLPSQPQITRYLGNGDYLVEGLLFNMAGTWTITVKIESTTGTDQANYQLQLDNVSERSDQDWATQNKTEPHWKDQHWTEQELNILRDLSLSNLSAAPDDPSNRYVKNPQAQALGRQLFFDPRFSANGKLSCASCHQPQRNFTDSLPRAIGMQPTTRNTPTIVATAWSRWFYWDGRRDSLWAQALVPFEAADEMGSSRIAVVQQIGRRAEYRALYQAVFGPFPDALLSSTLPKNAGPLGDKNAQNLWHSLPQQTQYTINRVYSHVGKAIAAYESTLLPQATRFDIYVDQLFNLRQNRTATHQASPALPSPALRPNEIEGVKLFIDAKKSQCLQCHNGPLLSNGEFHNIGSGNFSMAPLDFGRSLGIQAVLMDEFNCLGRFSDAPPDACSRLRFLNKSDHTPLSGAFKTPSLRQLKNTAPYFHDGRFKTLLDVMRFYNYPPKENGQHELKALNLTDQQLLDLVAFLNTLNEPSKMTAQAKH